MINKLCTAMERLEAELADFQGTHTASMRSLTTRMLAQQDAILQATLIELDGAENSG